MLGLLLSLGAVPLALWDNSGAGLTIKASDGRHASRSKIMPYLALVLIALGGWIKAAAAYQLHGYAWADQTCFRMRFFCNNSNLVLMIAIVAAAIAVTIEFLRSRSY